MANRNLRILVCVLLALAAQTAHSQVPSQIRPAYAFPVQTPADAGAASVQLGDTPMYVTPFLGLAAGRDDNLFLASTNEKSSSLYVTSPGLKVDARNADSVFQLAYQANLGVYADSRDDNYTDQSTLASVDFALSRQMYARLDWLYQYGPDPRGSTDRGISATPDRYRIDRPGITLVYGTPGAMGRVEAYYSDANKLYINNEATTSASNHDAEEFGAAFYWRVAPKTQLLVEARGDDIAYKDRSSGLSSQETRYYVGATWEATAQTSGTFKVGSLQKKFDSGLPSYSSVGWEALVTWLPRSYSRVDFYSARYPQESTGLGTFVLSEATGFVWTHNWNSKVFTTLNARYQQDKYQGFDRNDDTSIVGARVGYRFRRWLTLGAEYTYTKRDSSIDIYDYNKNVYMLTATASM